MSILPRRGLVLLAAMSLLAALPTSQAAPPAGWADAQVEQVTDVPRFPTDIDMAPDGSIWYVELQGNVSRYDPETGDVERVRHVPDVVTGRERGLVGLALAPANERTTRTVD